MNTILFVTPPEGLRQIGKYLFYRVEEPKKNVIFRNFLSDIKRRRQAKNQYSLLYKVPRLKCFLKATFMGCQVQFFFDPPYYMLYIESVLCSIA